MDLVGMCIAVEYSFGHMYGVSDDNYLGDVIDGACLIDTISDSKEFSFCTCIKPYITCQFQFCVLSKSVEKNPKICITN